MVHTGGAGLSPHYYRDNFVLLCDTVEAQYQDLLTGREQQFLQCYRELPLAAQCLYVRLISRTGPWFRESKLVYAELGVISPIVDKLLGAGFVELGAGLCVEELGWLYTRPELVQAFGAVLTEPAARGKPALLAQIEALGLDSAQRRELLVAVDPERVVAPLNLEEVQLFQLLFFGNRRQGLTDFVLSDLGVARYYPYPLDRARRLFPHREAVDEYIACAALGDCWYAIRESGDLSNLPALAAEMLAMQLLFPSSERRWHRLCNGLARDLERIGELELAAELYTRSERHPARERRLRILERREDWIAALQLGAQILAQPWCDEERDAADRVLPRVHRKLGNKLAARQRDNFAGVSLALSRQDAPVELLAARRLEADWAAVHYVENSLMNSLFGLAFWEQIFAPLPGVFHNPFQSVPADMYSPEFRRRRESLLAARLAELRAGDTGRILRQAYNKYCGFQCSWVDWRLLDGGLLDATTSIIPREHLLAIWQRMLFDPQENRRGFPDLLALGEMPGSYCLIEVKGPGDALQESQRRWLRFFASERIPAAVAWVSWRDSSDTGSPGRD